MESMLTGCNTSEKIKALIASRNQNQNDLAKILGLSAPAIVDRISANRWDVKEIEKIAETFGIGPKELI